MHEKFEVILEFMPGPGFFNQLVIIKYINAAAGLSNNPDPKHWAKHTTNNNCGFLHLKNLQGILMKTRLNAFLR